MLHPNSYGVKEFSSDLKLSELTTESNTESRMCTSTSSTWIRAKHLVSRNLLAIVALVMVAIATVEAKQLVLEIIRTLLRTILLLFLCNEYLC